MLSRSSPPAGSLSAAMAGGSEIGTVQAIFGSTRETDGPTLFEHVLKDAAGIRESEVHATLRSRASREPLAIARVLAGKYPQNPLVSYIPSVSWISTLRLAEITKDDALRQKVLNETRPWLSRERPLFGERIALTAVAGTLIYADLARLGEESARSLALQGADEALKVARWRLRTAWRRLDRRHVHARVNSLALRQNARARSRSRSSCRHAAVVCPPSAT